ncbi:hypothetical protein ASC75_08055 [Aminobacter sp. DSM 101952]|uniref:SRPBCC family protein n=1 Tax=unclassified Aminobacter TaxID=2644704 RepID=UPI0006FA97F3|nr:MULTISPECIES: SRPBCC family protein [unclassified Aminobacter]AWC23703.1 hypothetical protein CO731_03175 [Aminobacter sp. MSH1]KQU70067.1 hypothetical protein ASC75_08055 [Aminobacter sp. DSM 101952]
MGRYAKYAETNGLIEASPTAIYEFLDDQSNLSAHMRQSSGMMLGSSMDIHMEPDQARHVGSRFGFTGRILGIPLSVEEVVTGREPPISKTWETTAEPRLWVIGRYMMGFELAPTAEAGTILRVYIRYDLPAGGFTRLLGRVFGGIYAAWCTRQMVVDAQKHFDHQPVKPLKTTHS